MQLEGEKKKGVGEEVIGVGVDIWIRLPRAWTKMSPNKKPNVYTYGGGRDGPESEHEQHYG